MSQFVSVHVPFSWRPNKCHNLSPYTYLSFSWDRKKVTICLRTRVLFLETEIMTQFVSVHVPFSWRPKNVHVSFSWRPNKMSRFVSAHVPFSRRPNQCHNLSPYTCSFPGDRKNVTICLRTRALFLETEKMSQFVSVHVPFSLRPKKCHNLSPYTCPFPGDRTYCRDLSPYTCPFPGDRKNVTICLRTRVLFLETDGATRQSFKEEFGLKKR